MLRLFLLEYLSTFFLIGRRVSIAVMWNSVTPFRRRTGPTIEQCRISLSDGLGSVQGVYVSSKYMHIFPEHSPPRRALTRVYVELKKNVMHLFARRSRKPHYHHRQYD